MKFELVNGSYKSLKPFSWSNIPDFVVVTGKNGSGKTQLLELLNYHFGMDARKRTSESSPGRPFYQVQTKSDYGVIESKEVVFLPSHWNFGNIGSSNIQNLNQVINRIHSNIISPRDQEYSEIAAQLISLISKPKQEITVSDIHNNLPIDYYDYIHKIQIYEGLSETFKIYHGKYAELRDEGNSDNEIRQEIGDAPWEIINDLLDKANFPYKVIKPKSYIADYHFRLIGVKDSSIKINFEDLSAGEKVLISLGIWIFNTSRKKRLPKILLLDEPDAHLHPSAIKQFIDVVEKVLVNQYDVRVIMTTHSPTTVALAPEYALFEITSSPTLIKKIRKKDDGIGILTEGLLVVKSNSKYVLVEDKDDVQFYKAVFSVLKDLGKVNAAIPIIFIPASNKSANTSGGCTVVRNWVQKFVIEGADDIFQGLMDYDNGTNIKEGALETPNLKVVSRYSIENYLIDPILVYSSLLHENEIINVPGINLKHKDEHRVSKLPSSKLQLIANYIFREIEPLLPNLGKAERADIPISFINRRKLYYPKWFISRRGHDLYAKFKYKYKKGVDYNKLSNAMIRQQFIPKDLEQIMNLLQK
ncbi:ATP-binding protein [Poritiphilus flavus]|uniref:AAA family ATPase n=1 Tax=Poritiphilus flavus TaxID=2697053 RepID=A0A6L9E7H1_9FLAO|nr:ATP-binding protein [Poritiphilus flavus]NAS10568.1 AAA family ATPase [Poritiphilus flavus]